MKKLFTTVLAAAVLVAPAMAQEPQKSFEVSLFDQFQMVAGLGTKGVTEVAGVKTEVEKKADVHFRNRRMRFGATGTYGILEVSFIVAADNDIGVGNLSLDTAEATLNFMDEVKLSMGSLVTPTRGDQQSSKATMGIENFLTGSGLSGFGIMLSGEVANKIFEYALSLQHGMQPMTNPGSQHGVNGPLVGLQLRFNFLNEPTGGKDYFLGKKSAVTLGFSFAYQQMQQDAQKFYKFKGTEADQKNVMHFDVFLQGDVALGGITLPFMLIYEHVGMNPAAAEKVKSTTGTGFNSGNLLSPLASSAPMGKLTWGLGIYVDSLKIMPAFRHSIHVWQIDKDVIKGGLTSDIELSFGYFPYGNNLNLKIGYVYAGGNTEMKSGMKMKYDNHQLITQVQMWI